MIGMDLHSIISVFVKLAFLAAAATYSGLVLMSYLTNGAHLRPRFDLRGPARSAQRLAVWLGVMALALAVRAAARIFAMLSEASAEVGEWFLSRRHHETH